MLLFLLSAKQVFCAEYSGRLHICTVCAVYIDTEYKYVLPGSQIYQYVSTLLEHATVCVLLEQIRQQ